MCGITSLLPSLMSSATGQRLAGLAVSEGGRSATAGGVIPEDARCCSPEAEALHRGTSVFKIL